jgi:SAM-dependent methyltransferase
MPAFYVLMRACPSCRRDDLELLVSADAVAEEIELRRRFFAARIDGYVEAAQQKDRVDVAQNEPADVRVCRDCGIVVRGRGDAGRFQRDVYAPHVMEQMLRTYIDEFRAREPRVRPLLRDGARVVEVGSYVGGFLHVAAEWGWDALGLDVGEDTSHFSRTKGYPTRTASLEHCRFDEASFDGVFIWNTFEQIADPRALLAEVRRVLRPGGVLAIRTPNALFYAMCEAFLDLQRPRPLDDHDPIVVALGHANLLGFPHLYGFSAASLDRLVESYGFTRAAHVSSRHIPPTRHRLTATARIEEEKVNEAVARLEATAGEIVAGPWFEATYRL